MSGTDLELPVPDELHPRAGVRVRRRRELQVIAAQQGGCFTVGQAEQAGYDRRARHHHLSFGNWRRTVAPRVYRLTGWPSTEHEPLHAWLLWAGVGAALTSWTVLALRGHRPPPLETPAIHAVPDRSVPPDRVPAVPPDREPTPPEVHIVRARPKGRRTAATSPDGAVKFLTVWAPHRPAELLDDLVVRPLDEALCVALHTSVGRRAAWVAELTDTLLDDGRLELIELLETARETPSPAMLDLLWPRLRRQMRAAG